MSIGLVMIIRDEEDVIGRCLESVKPLILSRTIVDTGSSDRTPEIVAETLQDVRGSYARREWEGFGPALTGALRLARGTADWLLRLDADMTVDFHDDFLEWLDGDPDPTVDAWDVELEEAGTRWRLPLLVRGNLEWSYEGVTHEFLTPARNRRQVLGLTVTHHADGSQRETKCQRDLDLLRPGFEAGDPRSTFYYADTLRSLGRTDEAVEAFRLRAAMNDGFEEERWYASYRAAQLAGSPEELIDVWKQRRWRHEPLTAAARIAACSEEAHGDILFHEPAP